MDELVQWLREQLDEDAALAEAASPGPWHANAESDEVLAVDGITVADGFALSGRQLRATTEHIARHDPARVLREIDAKRQVLDDLLAEPHTEVDDPFYSCSVVARADTTRFGSPCDCGRDERLIRRLGLLALPYADRPGYREEWRP